MTLSLASHPGQETPECRADPIAAVGLPESFQHLPVRVVDGLLAGVLDRANGHPGRLQRAQRDRQVRVVPGTADVEHLD